ncbi:MAG: translation initiation factor eIF-6, partial [Thermoplasmata archaeon]
GLKTVGSVAVATNKGVVCHPKIRNEERKLLEDVLKVPVTIATANYGTTYVGACVVANSKGAVVGSTTTPIEIGRIEEGLVLY